MLLSIGEKDRLTISRRDDADDDTTSAWCVDVVDDATPRRLMASRLRNDVDANGANV